MPEFVTIQKFINVNSASVAKSVLEGNDIQAWLGNENSTVMAPHYGFFSGGVQLQVLAQDEDRARDVLAEILEDELADEVDPELLEATAEDDEDTDADATAHEDADDSGKTTLRVVHTRTEAGVLHGFLKAQGFAATVQAPASGWARGVNVAGGFMVNVPTEEAADARDVLDSLDADGIAFDSEQVDEEDVVDVVAEAIPDACPNCGSTEIHAIRIPPWLYTLGVILLLGLPLILPSRHQWGCTECGWEWKP